MKKKSIVNRIAGLGLVFSLLLTGCGAGNSGPANGDSGVAETTVETPSDSQITEETAQGTSETTSEATTDATTSTDASSQEEKEEDAGGMAAALTKNDKADYQDMGIPVVGTATSYDYVESEVPDDFFTYATMSVEAAVILEEGYDKLQYALQENAAQRKEDFAWYVDAAKEYGPDARMDAPEDSYRLGWEYEDTLRISRNDGKVLSYWSDVYSYLGGAHPNINTYGYNYVVETGEKLLLSDVVKDLDGLEQYAYTEMAKYAEELWEDWKDTVHKSIFGLEDYSVAWALTDSGLVLHYDAYQLSYYAFGPVEVEVPYENNESLFAINLGTRETLLCEDIGFWQTFWYDFDHDGNQDSVRVETIEHYNEEYGYTDYTDMNVFLNDGGVETDVALNLTSLDPRTAYVMENQQGKVFLYVSGSEENDYQSTAVVDISAPAKGAVLVGYNVDGSFYGNTPNDPEKLYLTSTKWIMGTWSVMYECHITEDGFLKTDYDYGRIIRMDWDAPFIPGKKIMGPGADTFCQVALRDFNAVFYEDLNSWENWNGSDYQVKKGTRLYPYITDGENYVLYQTDEGNFIQVSYSSFGDDYDWEKKIDGVSEYETLSDIIYAG